ncbi:hypothetical protein NP233_g7645 [Leucocoprinus birnbaumii]|uniref:Flavin-containing monooxygenase n=1 Tax=Leucocoprinus birnbaumii TaxID=56174 RepID=A0AAD5VNU5_9AGAR|nr:hypothetical protein NP233_g7645 [Leucocoprinus birnbaumii]
MAHSGYLRAFASWNQVNSNDDTTAVSYNTRVELVEKRLDASGKQIDWTLTTKKLEKIDGGANQATWNKEHFDAVVVASGWYNTPNVPGIEGLEQWGQKFPKAIFHSRQYRYTSDYGGKKALIVGAVASGRLISREVAQHATKVYQSVRPQRYAAERPTIYDYVHHIPQNVSFVAEIKRFHAPDSSSRTHASNLPMAPSSPVSIILFLLLATAMDSPSSPGIMTLLWGRTASLLLILFNLSLPMALTYDRSTSTPSISTIPLSASSSTATALCSPFHTPNNQARFALSMVWSGKARLPNRQEMWRFCHKRI